MTVRRYLLDVRTRDRRHLRPRPQLTGKPPVVGRTMRRLLAQTTLLCAAGAAALAVLASPAAASSRQLTIMHDEALLLRSGPTVRDRTLNELKGLGTDIVKIPVYWQEVAPGPRRPAGFDGTDPNDYNWSAYDGLVSGVVARGMRPMLESATAPPTGRWASGRAATTAPIARAPRSSGCSRPPSAAAIPASPCGRSGTSRTSPAGSRRSAPAGQGAAVAVDLPQPLPGGLPGPAGRRPPHDRILIGELAPTGSGTAQKVPPLTFLRERPASTAATASTADGRRASAAATGRPDPDGGARLPPLHAARRPARPPAQPRRRVDRPAGAGDAHARRAREAGQAAAPAADLDHRVRLPDQPAGPVPVPDRKVPGFMDESEWLAFHNRRVASVDQYQLIDDKLCPCTASPATRASSRGCGSRAAGRSGHLRGVADAGLRALPGQPGRGVRGPPHGTRRHRGAGPVAPPARSLSSARRRPAERVRLLQQDLPRLEPGDARSTESRSRGARASSTPRAAEPDHPQRSSRQ